MLSSIVVSSSVFRTKLNHIQQVVDTGWLDDAQKTAWNVVEYLREQTPKSSPPAIPSHAGAHLASGWTMDVIGGKSRSGRGILITIYNKFVTNTSGKILVGALLKTKSTGKKPYTLLHILEYGSRPHKIFSAGKAVLKFVTREGETIFTQSVDHPGTAPVGMIRAARVLAKRWFDEFFEREARDLRR